MITCGIDCGSETLKIVLLIDGNPKWQKLPYNSQTPYTLAQKALKELLEREGIRPEEIHSIVSTGIGRKAITFSHKEFPEFFCLAKAFSVLFPSVRTAIDGGAKNISVIKCSQGKILKYITNNKCASGTGVFLKIAADILEISVEELDRLSSLSKEPLEIQSTCAVFTESEIISLIHQKKQVEDIAAGVIRGLSGRIHALLIEAGIEAEIGFSGGLARIKGIVKNLEERTGKVIMVPENPEIMNALGAAILGKEVKQEE